VISASDISFAYDGSVVLEGAELLAKPGEIVGLIGPNGSGKTTLLRILYAALKPSAGFVSLDDMSIESLSISDIAQRIGVVAQESPSEIPLTVGEMVLLGRSTRRSALERYKREDYRIAAWALTRVGARHLADRNFGNLSGGEKQRVLIARTLAQQTDHLLLDEPTNHLDIRYQHDLLELVRTLGVTTVLVLHDLNLAGRYCDRLVLLDRGKIVASGTPEDVLTSAVLEPVYGVCVRRVEDPDCVQLVFRTRPVRDVPTPYDQVALSTAPA
jgi:iron complex transport system ATP-binding protein